MQYIKNQFQKIKKIKKIKNYVIILKPKRVSMYLTEETIDNLNKTFIAKLGLTYEEILELNPKEEKEVIEKATEKKITYEKVKK